MSMFSPYWKCNYDEMITFYPRFYREVFEMDAILRAEGRLADNVLNGIDKMLMNNFIDTMDEDTLIRFEAFLDIAIVRERTPDERRRFIKSFIAGMGKVSQTRIAEVIRAYTDTQAVCDFYPFDKEGNNRLDIKFERGNLPVIYISDIYTLLTKMLPAHICYTVIMSIVPDTPIELVAGIKICGIHKRILSRVEYADSSIFEMRTELQAGFSVGGMHKRILSRVEYADSSKFEMRTAFQAGFSVGGTHKKIRAEVREHGME